MSSSIDTPTKETARERASRIWHNNKVIREIKSQDHEPQPTHHAPTLKREILKILSQKNNDTLRNYMIAINERRRRLLKEKLRRLKAEQSNE